MYRLITGGARSGKSIFAESLYKKIDDVTYVASYVYNSADLEMKDRVATHQKQRNKKWSTIEVDYNLDVEGKNILFDCLAIFTSNILYYYSKDIEYIDKDLNEKIFEHLVVEIDKLFANNNDIIVVTNEVGYGLVPINHLERIYRDLLGRINRYVADKCDEVYLVVCGQVLKIKGGNLNEN